MTNPDTTGEFPPVQETATTRPVLDLSCRMDSDVESGYDQRLSWGSRSDVGLIRDHNEDSYLVRPPLFAVSDGMGGHAAGEVASSIAIHTIATEAPDFADSALLGAAVERANAEVIAGPERGFGREGMGCTATACIIDGNKMAVAHVGDSRLYLLHKGTLVRVTHDHSFVEELVDAGEITADEARVHPSRSVITRALGSDPDMYADHFTLDVEKGERIILCSDGLSSMITDAEIEDISVSTASAQQCADTLVSAALMAGGHDNVTVIVVDILSDGSEERRRHARMRGIFGWIAAVVAALAILCVAAWLVVSNSWYISTSDGYVAIYNGINTSNESLKLSHIDTVTDVLVSDLPESTQRQLEAGITVSDEETAKSTVESYQNQIEETKQKAEAVANAVTDATENPEDKEATS
jgi:protein phosphatase